ncbi:MAG: RIP metalloprotease RseP [Bacilli bacterium]|nr:RIP metalloprotease RseP [Bacilli bacterium]
MSIIINLLLFILILGVIVFVHEFGHFILAKMNGVYVYEFALGMGPKICGFKKGDTEYNLRAVPIGGFCQLAGEDLDGDDEKKIPKEMRLQNKKAWQRFLIMLFGPMNNFILAVILLFLIAAIWGGTTMNPIVSGVEKGSAIYDAGIKKGDKVISINGKKIETSDDLTLYLAIAPTSKKNKIVVSRDNQEITFRVKPKKVKIDGKDSYKYGVIIKQKKTKGLGNAFVYTFKKTKSIFKQMFITVGYLFTGRIHLNQLSGPVGIYSVVGQQRTAGLASIIYLTAFLSINVGFINLLPIPAFDGGHILFIIIEKIKGSPVKPELENKIHSIFLILLMLLMLVITFNDIIRMFN